MSYKTHLTVLEQSAALYPSSAAFRLPRTTPSGTVELWESISYRQFHLDVERFARHWHGVLSSLGLPPRAIVGLWCVQTGFAAVPIDD